jgi:hypothetical protein
MGKGVGCHDTMDSEVSLEDSVQSSLRLVPALAPHHWPTGSHVFDTDISAWEEYAKYPVGQNEPAIIATGVGSSPLSLSL